MAMRRSRWVLYLVLVPVLAAVMATIRMYRPPQQRLDAGTSVPERWKSLRNDVERFREEDTWVQRGGDAVPELIVALASDDWTLRWHVTMALGRIGKPARPAIPALIRLLDHSNSMEQGVTVRALNDIGCDDPDVLPRLVRCLADVPDPSQFLKLVSSFGASAIPVSIELIRSENRVLRGRGVQLLGMIGVRTQEAVAALREVQTDDELRGMALESLFALRACGPDDVRLMLSEKARRDSTPTGREVMDWWPRPADEIIALFRLVEPAEFLPDVRQLLVERRTEWQTVLSHIAGAEHLAPEWSDLAPVILAFLRDEDLGTRSSAVWALGRLDVDRALAVPTLRDLVLRDAVPGERGIGLTTEHVAQAAARILVKIAPDEARELATLFRKQVQSSQLPERLVAIGLLGSLSEQAQVALPEMREALRDPQLVDAAVAAVANLGPVAEPLVPDLLELLDEARFGLFIAPQFAGLQQRVCIALGKIAADRPDVQDALIKMFDRSMPAHREAILALANATTITEPAIQSFETLKTAGRVPLDARDRDVQAALAKLALLAQLQSATVRQFVSAAAYSEGPAWFDGELRFCSDGLMRANRAGEARKQLDLAPAGTFQRPDGHLLLCDNRTKSLLDLAPDGRVGVLADAWNGQPLRSLNDVTQDADGNIYWTDPEGSSIDHPIGRVFRLRPDGHVACVADDLAFPNGIEVDPRNQFLYVIESQTHKVLRAVLESFEYAPHPVARRFYSVFDLGGSGGDGCAFDSEGRLWVADFHRTDTERGRIVVLGVKPVWPLRTLEMIARLDIPAEAVSNVTFGGPNHDEIFCTTGNPNGVFHVRVGVTGFRGHAGKPLHVVRYLHLEPSAN